MASPSDPVQLQLPILNRENADRSLARMATWMVGLTSALLVMIAAGCYIYHRMQLATIATEHLRVVVTGPSRLQAGIATTYLISTTSISGQPLQVQVETALLTTDGSRLTAFRETTDEHGRLRITIPGDLTLPSQAILRVAALHRENQEEVAVPLTVEPTHYSTYLSTDKPLYRPGETMYYRSLTLPHLNAAAGWTQPVQFSILDSSGGVVPQSPHEAKTEHGVGYGTFSLPKSLPAGQYTLLVRNTTGSTADNTADSAADKDSETKHSETKISEQKRVFSVREYSLPRWKKDLEFARSCFTPGNKVAATFLAQRLDGATPSGVKLHWIATLDGQTVFEKDEVLEKNASGPETLPILIEFDLPKAIERGEGQLAVTIADGDVVETQTKSIPILRGDITVDFFPEGGELVSGLETRVYFAAHDSLGRPVALSGAMVIDDESKERDTHGKRPRRDEDLAAVETTYNGMGTFAIIPQAGEKYRLKIIQPAGIPCQSKLLEVSQRRQVVLSTGAGVFAAGTPMEFNIRAVDPGLPLVLAAYRHGVQVGEQPLVTKTSPTGANPVSLTLDEAVSGILRLVVYDYSVSPPQAVAERLVYRRPLRFLSVRPIDSKDRYMPGEAVQMSLLVANEKKETSPSIQVPSVLGVSVVNEALLSLADRRSPGMLSFFQLTDGFHRSEILENADFYLSDASKENVPAAVALDLLLGTQACCLSDVEKASPDSAAKADKKEAKDAVASQSDECGVPPLMLDNIHKIRDNYDQSLAGYREACTRTLHTVITIAFYGGVGLLLLVAMIGLMRITWGMHLWIPASAAVVSCLVIGAILFDPSSQPLSPDKAVAFQSYPAAMPNSPEKTTSPAVDSPKPNEGGDANKASQQEKQSDRAKSATETKEPSWAYENSAAADAKNDEAAMLYWNPLLVTGADGKAAIHFDLPKSPATYRVIVDAQGDGRLGVSQTSLLTRVPTDTGVPEAPSATPETAAPPKESEPQAPPAP